MRRHALPGFGPALGVTLGWAGLVVLVPLAALAAKAAGLGAADWLRFAADPRVQAAFALSFGGAAAAVLVVLPCGLLVAWVLVRYRFPGRHLVDALVDLPFALPTAVAGITLTALALEAPFELAFTRPGVVVALAFIGLPFIVRTVQPVLAELDREAEEAAVTLGAGPWARFRRVLLPPLYPALATGAALAFARTVGEYGSVIFIAGNQPGRTEILPLLIVARLEQFDYAGASAIAVMMLVAAALVLLGLGQVERRVRVP